MTVRSVLRARLAAGETATGVFLKCADPTVVEIVAGTGYDFLIADLEHSSLALRDVETIARIADGLGVGVIARISRSQIEAAGRILETGAIGIQLTDVSDTATLAALRDAMRHPPHGRRSLALSHRAARYGRMPIADYLRLVEGELLTVAQVESRAALDALDELLAADAPPDIWFLGPVDLANDLGHPGDQEHPEVQAAYERVLAAVHGAGRRSGVFARNAADARAWRARGVSMIAVGSDLTLLSEALRESLAGAREAD